MNSPPASTPPRNRTSSLRRMRRRMRGRPRSWSGPRSSRASGPGQIGGKARDHEGDGHASPAKRSAPTSDPGYVGRAGRLRDPGAERGQGKRALRSPDRAGARARPRRRRAVPHPGREDGDRHPRGADEPGPGGGRASRTWTGCGGSRRRSRPRADRSRTCAGGGAAGSESARIVAWSCGTRR